MTSTGSAATATRAEDRQRAIAAVVLAFSTDPVVRFAYPDSQDYLAYMPELVEAFGGRAFDHGTAYATPDYSGAALWLPPGVRPDEEAMGELMSRSLPPQKLETLGAVLAQMDSYHPHEPHYYLPLIGVEPFSQRKGYGSALLQPVLEICDRQGIPAYLESSNPANISLYLRHGFEELATIGEGDCPPITPMLRKPQA